MSQYSKAQENRTQKKFEVMGFKLVKDTGRLTQHRGDKIMYHEDTGLLLCIDHKSTRGKEGIRIERAQLEKIASEAGVHEVPAITFSFLGCHDVYVIFNTKDLEGMIY